MHDLPRYRDEAESLVIHGVLLSTFLKMGTMFPLFLLLHKTIFSRYRNTVYLNKIVLTTIAASYRVTRIVASRYIIS